MRCIGIVGEGSEVEELASQIVLSKNFYPGRFSPSAFARPVDKVVLWVVLGHAPSAASLLDHGCVVIFRSTTQPQNFNRGENLYWWNPE